jgi:helicase
VIRARFIGVGKFLDPLIPELTGCARDATALCTLFEDTIDGLDARAFVDGDATLANTRQALADTLGGAEEGDAVILAFATHGTQDHRIVVHDTSLANLDSTALSMAVLADAFRECRAKFILCILDCCFGGAAPARVILGTPKSRALIDLSAFAGEGRLLLAASGIDEPAYEHPARRHGLLTAALIDALTSGDHAGVLSLVEHVISRVRTEASAMGVTQRPVATAYIDGGFILPILRRGARFRLAFPEYSGIRVSTISDISSFGIPPSVIDQWKAQYNDHLHPLQADAINECRVLDGQSLFVLAPTSSGKTFIGELAAVRAIVAGRKAVFLLPYKALVNEKFDDFESQYGDKLGMRIVRCTGDHHDQIQDFVTGRFDIALLTYEMFLGIAISRSSLLNLIGLIVLDEAQLITDESRGIHVELLLTFLRTARARQIAPQLVLLSATVGALNYFDEWLDVRTLRSETRPVPLEYGVLDRSGTYQYLDPSGTRGVRQLLRRRVEQRKIKPSSQDVIVPLIQQLLSDQNAHETVIVFRNTRGSAEGCANYLASELGLPAASEALIALPTGDLSTSSPRLRSALIGGTAFHSTNLSRVERVIVEQAFRARNSKIRVLAATSGVAAGINTPASTVVIVETVYAREHRPPISVGAARNMAGRAGRFGFRETGRAIILADTPFERQQLFEKYVLGASEPITSSFALEDLATWIVRLLRQVDGIPKLEVSTMLINTYGGYLQTRRDPGFSGRLQAAVPVLLTRMEKNNLIAEDERGLHLTELGRACGQSTLAFESCIRLIEALRTLGTEIVSPELILALTESLPESDETFVPLQKKGTAEVRWSSLAASRLGQRVGQWFGREADTMKAAARAKRTLIALEWADGSAIDTIERKYTSSPFNASPRETFAGSLNQYGSA